MIVAMRNRILSDAERRTGALAVPERFGPAPGTRESGFARSAGDRLSWSSSPAPGLRSASGVGDTRTPVIEKE
jgi:hypothetical protein